MLDLLLYIQHKQQPTANPTTAQPTTANPTTTQPTTANPTETGVCTGIDNSCCGSFWFGKKQNDYEVLSHVILMGSHVHGVTLLIRASVGSIVMFKFVSSEDMVVSEDIIPYTWRVKCIQ